MIIGHDPVNGLCIAVNENLEGKIKLAVEFLVIHTDVERVDDILLCVVENSFWLIKR